MNNPQMANNQIRKDLSKILNIKSEVNRSRPVKGLIKKEAFCKFVENYKYANDRTLMLKQDFQVDFVHYEEVFVLAIEALIEVAFNKKQKQLIEWWLYEKWSVGPEDEVLQLQHTETGEELPTDTPEQLWDLLQTIK